MSIATRTPKYIEVMELRAAGRSTVTVATGPVR
jgi:hypothetical protein